MNERRRGPVLIEDDPAPVMPETPPGIDNRHRRPPRVSYADEETPSPADAAPVDDGPLPVPQPRTMQLVARIVGAGPSPMTRFFINSGVALFTFILSVAAMRWLTDLMERYPLLGWVGVALLSLFCLGALGMAWREYRAWSRFGVIDGIARESGAALASGDVQAAGKSVDRLSALYRARPELALGRNRLTRDRAEAYDAATLISSAEANLLAPLDALARAEIEAAARTVAATTALIPLPLADVLAALAANLRMIRRMAEIYGGRAGAVGGWRLARTVMTHIVATGVVASGDDLIQTMAGGGVMAKISKRFGEGVVNGALTARVGIAAMEVCRPLPFVHQPRPTVGSVMGRALTGLFDNDQK